MSRKITAPDPESRARAIQDKLFRQMKNRERNNMQRGNASGRSKSRTRWSKEKLRRELEDMDTQIEEEAMLDRRHSKGFESDVFEGYTPSEPQYDTPIQPNQDFENQKRAKEPRSSFKLDQEEYPSKYEQAKTNYRNTGFTKYKTSKTKDSVNSRNKKYTPQPQGRNKRQEFEDFALTPDNGRISARAPGSRRSSRKRKHHRRVSSNLEDLNRYREFREREKSRGAHKQKPFKQEGLRKVALIDQQQHQQQRYSPNPGQPFSSRNIRKQKAQQAERMQHSYQRQGERTGGFEERYREQARSRAMRAQRGKSRGRSKGKKGLSGEGYYDEGSEEEAYYFQSLANNSQMNFDYGNLDPNSQMDLPFD